MQPTFWLMLPPALALPLAVPLVAYDVCHGGVGSVNVGTAVETNVSKAADDITEEIVNGNVGNVAGVKPGIVGPYTFVSAPELITTAEIDAVNVSAGVGASEKCGVADDVYPQYPSEQTSDTWPTTNARGGNSSEPHSSSAAEDDFDHISTSSSFFLSLSLVLLLLLLAFLYLRPQESPGGVLRLWGLRLEVKLSYRSIFREAMNERKGAEVNYPRAKRMRGKARPYHIANFQPAVALLASAPPTSRNVEKHKRVPLPDGHYSIPRGYQRLQSETGIRPGLLIVQKRDFLFVNFGFIDWAFAVPIMMALVSESVNTNSWRLPEELCKRKSPYHIVNV